MQALGSEKVIWASVHTKRIKTTFWDYFFFHTNSLHKVVDLLTFWPPTRPRPKRGFFVHFGQCPVAVALFSPVSMWPFGWSIQLAMQKASTERNCHLLEHHMEGSPTQRPSWWIPACAPKFPIGAEETPHTLHQTRPDPSASAVFYSSPCASWLFPPWQINADYQLYMYMCM